MTRKRRQNNTPTIQYKNMGFGTIPMRFDEYSIGYDLYTPRAIVVPAHSRFYLNLEFGIGLPFGVEGKVEPRSGFSGKGIEGYGAKVIRKKFLGIIPYHKTVSGKMRFNCDVLVGKIDPGYKGRVKVILKNDDVQFTIPEGTKIAQMTFYRTLQPKFIPVDELTGYDRGGGLGHSGAK